MLKILEDGEEINKWIHNLNQQIHLPVVNPFLDDPKNNNYHQSFQFQKQQSQPGTKKRLLLRSFKHGKGPRFLSTCRKGEEADPEGRESQ